MKTLFALAILSFTLQASEPQENNPEKDYARIRAEFDKADKADFANIPENKKIRMSCVRGEWKLSTKHSPPQFVIYQDDNLVAKETDPFLGETASIRVDDTLVRKLRPDAEGHLKLTQVFPYESGITETQVGHLRTVTVNGVNYWFSRLQIHLDLWNSPWKARDTLCYGNKEVPEEPKKP